MSLNNEGEHTVDPNADEGVGTPSRGSKKWIGAAAGAAAVAALAVGGVALVSSMGGGGAQPEDVLPGNAIAFAKLDLNPAVGQKVAAFQLARKFPQAKDKVTSQETSIKQATFGNIFSGPDEKDTLGLDYKKDIEPWLGDRVGVGAFPDMDGDKKTEWAVAIAYTDQGAAKAALDKGIANILKREKAQPFVKDPSKTGYAFADGYVILSDTTAHATALVKAGKTNTLAASKYTQDVKSLGSEQIGVAWVDIAAVVKAAPKDALGPLTGSPLRGAINGGKDPKNISGRFVSGLHADPSFLEVTGKAIEIKGVDTVKPVEGVKSGMLATFPSDVFGGVTIPGLGRALGTVYTSLVTTGDAMRIKPMLAEMGIDSAQKIETLFGVQTGVMASGTKENPEFAVRTQVSDPDAAVAIANRALRNSPADSMGITVKKITGPDGIVVAFGPNLSRSLLDASGGKLEETDAFKKAMPDASKTGYAEYVNLTRVVSLLPEDPKTAWTKQLSAFGVTAIGGAEPTVRMRLTVK